MGNFGKFRFYSKVKKQYQLGEYLTTIKKLILKTFIHEIPFFNF